VKRFVADPLPSPPDAAMCRVTPAPFEPNEPSSTTQPDQNRRQSSNRNIATRLRLANGRSPD
jgi:hypothetical protein